jgi:L-threonylcarbamoyladenylate synthase
MKTSVIPATDPDVIKHVLAELEKGGLVAFPTDTVYGIGSLAFDGEAVERIYTAKNRSVEKAIPVLIGQVSDLEKVCVDIPLEVYKLVRVFWPGPLTIVMTKHPHLPVSVSSYATVGVRVPDHRIAQNILVAAGPMAVSSANISGQDNPSTADDVFRQLDGRVPLIVDGGTTPGGVPSTVVDFSNGKPHIIREGPIKTQEILAVLNSDL